MMDGELEEFKFTKFDIKADKNKISGSGLNSNGDQFDIHGSFKPSG